MARAFLLRSSLLQLFVVGWGLGLASPALAERPNSALLLPESTLAVFRVADSRDLVERFQQTAAGRIGNDEQVKPLVGQLYSSIGEAFAAIEEEVGLSLDKILALPQGEICLAVTAPPAGLPAFMLIVEVGDQVPSIDKLLERLDEVARQRGSEKSTETVGDVELISYTFGSGDREKLTLFLRDGVLVAGNHGDQIKDLLAAWDGKLDPDNKRLASNRRFTTVVNRCQGDKDNPPQILWYVDPVTLAKVSLRNNATAQVGLAILPVLGLDGLQAIGGSITMATEEFDEIQHLHILLEEPRSGVIEAIALASGDVTPEPWVPVDCSTYITLNFDVERSYDSIAKVYNSIRGENALQNEVQRNINDRLELDFERDLLAACNGRFTMLTWVQRPIQLGSQTNVIGVQLKDPKAFGEVVDKFTKKFADRLEKSAYGTTTYWRVKTERPQEAEAPRDGDEGARRRRLRMSIRNPEPCFAILGDYLLFSDSVQALEHMIVTSSDPSKGLANDLEFKLILSKMRRQPGGANPSMIAFSHPEESMKMFYELVQGEELRGELTRRAERNPFFKNVDKALNENPLPPFAVIAKYLAPSGGLMTTDETGIHYASFTLRRKSQ